MIKNNARGELLSMKEKVKIITNNGEFPIGAYFGPFPKDPRWPDDPDVLNDESYKLAHDGGFNFMISFVERYPANVANVHRALDCAARNGMRMILSDENIEQGTVEAKLNSNGRLPDVEEEYRSSILDHGDHPGYWGCYVVDEPLPRAFVMTGLLRDIFYKVSPDKLFFVNMLPIYAIQSMKNTDWIYDDAEREQTYSDYLRGYIEYVRPEVLCYDYYPYMKKFPEFSGEFFVNLAIARKESERAGIPFWVSPQAGAWADPNCRGLSVGEMRHQVYCSLAFGAKGLVYYVWSASAGHTQGITKDGKPTYLYSYVKECNLLVKKIQSDLLADVSLGVIVTGTTPGRIPPYALAEDCGNIESVQAMHVLTGIFENDGVYNYIIVNNSITDKERLVVRFKNGRKRKVILSDRQFDAEGQDLQLDLDIGDCAFIKEV